MGSQSLRNAKTNDIWRSLFKKNNRSIVDIDIQYTGIPELGDGHFSVKYPMNLICGENGAGKTALLALIFRALCHEHPHNNDEHILQFGGRSQIGVVSKIAATVRDETSSGNKTIYTVEDLKTSLNHSSEDGMVALIDPAETTGWILSLIRTDANFKDLIEGVTPITFGGQELEIVSNLVGKSYNEINIYEIDAFDDHPPFPYFQATYGSATYDSMAMGKGEACLLYLYWAIKRLPPKTIALIEEPDAFAALRSHRSIADFLANACLENDHLFVVSSHSGAIAERFPDEAIQLCSRTSTGISITPNPTAADLISRLGLNLRSRVVAIVEDEAAGSFLASLLGVCNSRLASSIEMLIASGNGGISNSLRILTRKGGSKITIIGAWDADQNINNENCGDWAKVKLPGEFSPEIEILSVLDKVEPLQLVNATGITQSKMHAAIASAEGMNHHDRLSKIAEHLSITSEQLINTLMPEWVRLNSKSSKEFVNEFAKLVK